MKSKWKALRSAISIILCASILANSYVFAAGGDTSVSGENAAPETVQDSGVPLEDLEQPPKINEELDEDAVMDSGALRMPEIPGMTDPDKARYGDPVDFGEFYLTYEIGPGAYKTIYTASPVAYYDRDGELRLIDNTLIESSREAESEEPSAPRPARAPAVQDSGFELEDTKDEEETESTEETGEETVYTNDGPVEAEFPEEMEQDAGFSFQTNEYDVELIPMSGDYTKAAVRENAIRYNNVYDGIDVQYTVYGSGVKEDIILNRYVERNSFAYKLKTELDPVLRGGIIYLYEPGADNTPPAAYIEAPRMTDAAGAESTDVELDLRESGSGYIISVNDTTPNAAI